MTLVTPALVHRRDVALGERLEQVLVADAPSGVARAELTRTEHRERDARALQDLDHRARDRPARGRRTSRRIPPSRGTRAPARPRRSPGRRARRPSRLAGPAACPRGCSAPSRLRSKAPASAGNRRLGHHEVASKVHDRVDVLDVDRAFLHARAAGRARPHGLLVDRRRARAPSARRPRRCGGPERGRVPPRRRGRAGSSRAASATAVCRCSTPDTSPGTARTRCTSRGRASAST